MATMPLTPVPTQEETERTSLNPLNPSRGRYTTFATPSDNLMDETMEQGTTRCWPTPMARHVHDDPFATTKLPYPLRFKGSAITSIWPHVLAVGVLATIIVVVSKFTRVNLGISPTLTSVLGFIVGLSITFRNTTAYERYAEGRKLWNQLQTVTRNMGRTIWLQIPRGKDTLARDILANRSAINMLLAFAIALKHHLREERGAFYDDLYPFVCHLPRHHQHFMNDGRPPTSRHGSHDKSMSPMSMLSDSTKFTDRPMSDMDLPSSLFKHDQRDLAAQGTLVQGNLPLEIANYLTNFAEVLNADGRLTVPLFNTLLAGTNSLVEVLTMCERILRTPIPLAYNIVISQAVWGFCILLPFQLTALFSWVTIPASMITAWILFGLLHISYEIENPFGYDINDLDLDRYCRGLAVDLDLICSYLPGQDPHEWLYSEHNKPLWPLQRPVSFSDARAWGVDTVKERLEERRKRVMELWGKGLAKVEEERARHSILRRKTDSDITVIRERELSPSSTDSIV